mmetsp:Transcript_30423/g.73931  ORF Transcript_30423/g.73931 Transcript_30423/m.73931 type:complete len:588 (+) Transcript_30423:119-1882(+)
MQSVDENGINAGVEVGLSVEEGMVPVRAEATPPVPATGTVKHPQLSSIILPESMRPGLSQILASSEADEISEDDLISIVFIIRLIDALHTCFYATFLSLSLTDLLKKNLGVPQLDLETIEVYATRWSWNGLAPVYHHISWDFDMAASYELSEIARKVIEKEATPKEGLLMIHEYETNPSFSKFESFYRNMPGRILVLTVMSASSSFAFFKGSWIDVGFAGLTGLAAGTIYCAAVNGNQLIGKTLDMLISVTAGMIATIGITVAPDDTCFSAEVLGTLFWFLYGVAFFISLSEIYNGQLVCGVTRLALALLNTFGLAFGVSLGLWIAAYGGEERYALAGTACSGNSDYEIPKLYLLLFYPITCVTALMQIRVKLRHWPIALMTQAVAVVSQYFIDTYWKQPEFVANVIPAYLATVFARLFLAIGFKFDVSGINAWSGEVLVKREVKQLFAKEAAGIAKIRPASNWSSPPAAAARLKNAFRFEEMLGAKNQLFQSGYFMQKGKMQYQHSTIWFCILPAIYLLVPGSSLFRDSFSAFWGGTEAAQQGTSAMVSVFIIGFGQAAGVRLAMVSLDALDQYIFQPCMERRKRG